MDTTVHHHSSSWIRSVLRQIIPLVRNPARRHTPTHTTTRPHVPHSPNVYPHSTAAHIRENVVHELSTRIARSVEICQDYGRFSNNDGLWRKRARACIEVTASLVCCANAKLAWFGGISKLLGDIGSSEKIRKSSVAGTDELFVMRWTCLSLVAIRSILADNGVVRNCAMLAMESLAEVDDARYNSAQAAAQKIDETLQRARDCLFQLNDALRNTEDLRNEKILQSHEYQISRINIEADRLKWVDYRIIDMQNAINNNQIISQLPGILDNLDPNYQVAIPFSRLVDLSHHPRKLQFICPGKTLKSMCSPALTLRNNLGGQEDADADAYKELTRKNLENFRNLSGWQGDEMQRQFWRLQDLRDGGGLGFTVELFFLALSQPRTSLSKKSVSLCTIHGHVSGHHIRLEQVQTLVWNTKAPSLFRHDTPL